MEGEVKEKPEQKRVSVSITLKDIPVTVHNKLIKFNRKINADRNKDYNLKEAYVEFLKEATKSLQPKMKSL